MVGQKERARKLDKLELKIEASNSLQHVVKIRGAYMFSDESWFLVREYMEAGSLANMMFKSKGVDEQKIAEWMHQILLAVDELHSNGRVHGDIRSSHFLLDSKGTLKSLRVGRSLKGSCEMRGSPYWKSPQEAAANQSDIKSDIWSIGITAIELRKGEPPNVNVSAMRYLLQLVTGRNLPKLEGNEHSEEFKDFVNKCLSVDPAQRPSAKELQDHPFITKYKSV